MNNVQSIISKFKNHPKKVNINNCLDKKSKLRSKVPIEINILNSGILPDVVARKCFARKRFLEILQNSQKNTYVRVSFLIKHWCFLVNFAKFLKTPILLNIPERLLLIFVCLFSIIVCFQLLLSKF